MMLAYNELKALVESGAISNVAPSQINGASIDLTLGDTIMVERFAHAYESSTIDLSERESIRWHERSIRENTYVMAPGEFILAHSREVFNLPDNISGILTTKSSIGRNGLDHMQAGWIDAGFHNSVLTFEFKNETRYHKLRIRPGMPVAQVTFFAHTPVPADQSYRARGRYNGDMTVRGIKL